MPVSWPSLTTESSCFKQKLFRMAIWDLIIINILQEMSLWDRMSRTTIFEQGQHFPYFTFHFSNSIFSHFYAFLLFQVSTSSWPSEQYWRDLGLEFFDPSDVQVSFLYLPNFCSLFQKVPHIFSGKTMGDQTKDTG